MTVETILSVIKNVIDMAQNNWDIITVFVVGVVTAIKNHNLSKFIQTAVTTAELSFERVQFEEKLNNVLAKINAKHPIVYFLLGKTFLIKAINKEVDRLQEAIGTTSDRIAKQASHLNHIIDNDIIEHTKELTAKVLANNIMKRDFFGNLGLASNEQVEEELRKILDGGKEIVDRINGNIKVMKEKMLGKLNVK